MATDWKGAPAAAALCERLRPEVDALRARGIAPKLVTLRVGERGDDISYENAAIRRCENVGILAERHVLPADVAQDALLQAIAALNADASVHGVLLLRPLPGHMDEELVRNALAPEKDVDGITDGSLAGVFTGSGTGFPPCTAQACMELLDHYGYNPAGKRAVVIGRSLVVGKPLAMMLLARNATVTMCHSRTPNLQDVCRAAQLLVVAIGRSEMVDAASLAPGQAVLDVGINVDDAGNLHGDVNYADAASIVDSITPVPGGIGAMTTAVLAKHVVEAAGRSALE